MAPGGLEVLSLTKIVLTPLLALVGAGGWIVAAYPRQTRHALFEFYSSHPLIRTFAPLSMAVLQTKRTWPFRLAGLLIGLSFSLTLVGLLVWGEAT